MRGFRQVSEVVWELAADARADMRAPARVFADLGLIEQIAGDHSLEQLQNVATLPEITGQRRRCRHPSGRRVSGLQRLSDGVKG